MTANVAASISGRLRKKARPDGMGFLFLLVHYGPPRRVGGNRPDAGRGHGLEGLLTVTNRLGHAVEQSGVVERYGHTIPSASF